jgi:hypothetical protein
MNTRKEQTHYWARLKGCNTAEILLHTHLGVFYRIGQHYGFGYDKIDWISDDPISTVNPPPQIVDGAYYVIDTVNGKQIVQCKKVTLGDKDDYEHRFYLGKTYWYICDVNTLAGPMTPEDIVQGYKDSKKGDH